jgi:hypothetical protein
MNARRGTLSTSRSYPYSGSSESGQALAETLVGLLLVVPLLYGILFLSDLLRLQHDSIATTRHALMLAHHAEGQVSDSVLQSWFTARQQHLALDTPWALQAVESKIELKPVEQVSSVTTLEQIAFVLITPAQIAAGAPFSLARNAARSVTVETRWRWPNFLRDVLDSEEPLLIRERLIALHDTWGAADARETEERVLGLSMQAQLRKLADPFDPIKSAIALVEPAFTKLCLGRVAVDVVPTDRVQPSSSLDMRTQPC